MQTTPPVACLGDRTSESAEAGSMAHTQDPGRPWLTTRTHLSRRPGTSDRRSLPPRRRRSMAFTHA